MELTLRQKKQATLLYHYASLEYLKPVQKMVNDVIKGIDITLQLASDEGRDRFLVNERWGARDTSANWSTYAFPALLDLQKSVAKQISNVAFESYGHTGVYNCQRTMDERSMNWATEDEEDRFEKQMEALADYAYPVDCTLSRGPQWRDDVFHDYWQKTKANFPRIPQFRLREDVLGESDKKPPRTGVYAPIDDPYGALQFAWTGDNYGELCDCTTFNQMGLDAVHAVGIENLWNDSPRLLSFLLQSSYRDAYEKECRKCNFDPVDPVSATAYMSGDAFIDLPRKWVYVEILPDAYEELAAVETAESVTSPTGRLRAEPNDLVPKTGWWHSQAKPNGQALHYFEAGQHFPDWHTTHYGSVIWGFDPDEQKEPPKR